MKNPSVGAASRHAASDPKKCGFTTYGPPSSGQNTSQLPHALQKSRNVPIWCFSVTARTPFTERVPRAVPPREVHHGNFTDGDREREVRVVGADGDALVARQAVEQLQVAPDLPRDLGGAGAGVATLLDHPVGVALRCSAGWLRIAKRASVASGARPPRAGTPSRNARDSRSRSTGSSSSAVEARLRLAMTADHPGRPCPPLRSEPCALVQRLEVPVGTPVAPGLQQVAAHGHRHEPERDRLGEVAAVDARGERDGVAVAELPPEPPQQLDRQDVRAAGPTRYISRSDDGKKLRWFSTMSVLVSFTPKPRPSVRAVSPSRSTNPHICGQRGVAARRRPAARGVRRSPGAAGCSVVSSWPSNVGFSLTIDVQAELAEQEVDDPLDLVGRAAVEGAEGQGVGDARREVEVAQARELARNLGAKALDDGRRVEHATDEGLHAVTRDPRVVVADAHVEDGLGEARRHVEPAASASIRTSRLALTYSSRDCSSFSSCDHSTL